MRNILNIFGIGVGLILIFVSLIYSGDFSSSQGITWTGQLDGRIFIVGIILILYNFVRFMGFFSFMNKEYYQKEADKFNYKETNSNFNCFNCKYIQFNGKIKSSKCNFFNIDTDENHVCDLHSN